MVFLWWNVHNKFGNSILIKNLERSTLFYVSKFNKYPVIICCCLNSRSNVHKEIIFQMTMKCLHKCLTILYTHRQTAKIYDNIRKIMVDNKGYSGWNLYVTWLAKLRIIAEMYHSQNEMRVKWHALSSTP